MLYGVKPVVVAVIIQALLDIGKKVTCTACQYCIPCKNGVDIPRIFDMYNEGIIYNFPQNSRRMYNAGPWFKPEQKADKCQDCNECIEKCPQKLEIPKLLKEAHEYMTATDKYKIYSTLIHGNEMRKTFTLPIL